MGIGSFLGGIGLKIMAALAVVATVVGILLGAKNAGRTAERAENMARTLEGVKKREEIETSVRSGSGDDARERLHRNWSRD